MELLGWILAGIAGVFSTGLVIGVVLTSRRAIHITQTNSVSQTNNASGGGGRSGPSAPAIFPVMALLAVGVVAVAAITSAAQSGAQVSAVSQQALQTQREIVQAYPQPQQPVIVEKPVPAMSQGIQIGDVAIGVILGVAVLFLILKLVDPNRKRKPKHPAPGITHPLFSTKIDQCVK